MNITYRKGIELLDGKSLGRAETKLERLSKFVTERTFETQTFVDIEPEAASHVKHDQKWRASIRVKTSHTNCNASEVGATPQKALELAIKELRQELRRQKEKTTHQYKRAAALFKYSRVARSV